MIHILLLILKIAGILLLVLLGLVLAALLCLLFVPVRYRIQGSRHGQLQAHGQLSWLLHIITLHGWYQSQELEVKLKLFGFTLWPRQKKEKKKNGRIRGRIRIRGWQGNSSFRRTRASQS